MNIAYGCLIKIVQFTTNEDQYLAIKLNNALASHPYGLLDRSSSPMLEKAMVIGGTTAGVKQSQSYWLESLTPTRWMLLKKIELNSC